MQVHPTTGSRALSAAEIGLALGLCVGLAQEFAGTSPLALTGVAAAFLVGLGAGAGWARAGEPYPTDGVLALGLGMSGVTGLAAVALSRAALGTEVALGLGGAIVLGLGVGRTGLPPARAARLALGPALVLGAEAPALGMLLMLVCTAIRAWRSEPPAAPAARAPWLGAALAGVGAALATAGAAAGRAALDPTPRGALLSAAAAIVGAALIGVIPPVSSRRSALPAVALGALGLVVAVWAVGGRAAGWITPMAGLGDPRPLLAALGAALVLPGAWVVGRGLAWGSGPLTPVAIALGMLVGLQAGPDARRAALWLAIGAGAAGAVLVAHWALRLGSVALAVAALGVGAWLPWPEPALLQAAAYNLRGLEDPTRATEALAGYTPAAGGWGPDGAVLVLERAGQPPVAFLDGAMLPAGGREADAEQLLAALGALAVEGRARALVLGEARGLVSAALVRQGFDRVLVPVTHPEGLRARALADPELAEALLQPAVQLRHGPQELILSGAPPQDLIVELARLPWADGEGGLPSLHRLGARHAALAPRGAYVLLVPTTWMDRAELQGLVADMLRAFPHTWAALPARGADHLLLLGWAEAPAVPWARVQQVAERDPSALLGLGLRTPEDLADRLWASPDFLIAWAAAGERGSPWALGPALHRRPSLLLPELAGMGGDPAGWLGADGPREELRRRAKLNGELLALLAQAREGDMQGVVERGRALSQDPVGQRALDPILEPSMQRAEAALEEGLREGPQSLAWARCIQEVEAARLLAPRSAQLHSMAGRCRLAQGDARRALEEFDRALALDPGELDALLGAAQALNARGEVARAEARLREATRTNPRLWRPWYHLGALLMDLGRLDEAAAALAQARGLAGEDGALAAGAEAHVALLQGDPNAALVHAERAVQLDPSARNLHLRGLCWLELDQIARAERDFRDAVYADPAWWPAHGDLGRIFAARGEYKQAIDAFERVLAQVPDNAAAQQNLARARALAAEREAGPPGASGLR